MELIYKYADSLFEEMPVSQQREDALALLKSTYEGEYTRLKAEGRAENEAAGEIISRYGSLDAAGTLIGLDLLELQGNTAGVLNEADAAKLLRSIKMNALLWAGAYYFTMAIISAFVYGSIINALLVAACATVLFVFAKKGQDKMKDMQYGSCSMTVQSAALLRHWQGVYQHRFITIAICAVALLFVCLLPIIYNFNQYTFLELWGISNFGLIVTAQCIAVRNGVIMGKLDRMFSKASRKGFARYMGRIFAAAGLYWAAVAGMAAAAGVLYKKLQLVWNIVYCGIIVFVILFIGVEFLVGRRRTVVPVSVSRGRKAAMGAAVALWGAYNYMNSGSWLLQPYVATIPAVEHRELPVAYDKDSGAYTIIAAGGLKILQLTDIHIGGSAISASKDKKALEAVYALIEYTRPDLIIVTGDLVFPLGIQSFSFNNYTPFLQFCSFMRNIGIPWAFVYGNHDTEFVASNTAADLNALFDEFNYARTGTLLYSSNQPQIYGRSNQVIRVLNPDGSVNQLLVLLDSNDYSTPLVNDYDSIHEDQVEWYRQVITEESEAQGETVSSLLFFHIPLQEYRTAYELYKGGSDEVEYFYGDAPEGVSCSRYESTLFEAAVELGSTQAMFVGHDHYNDLSVGYEGIRLTYGKSIDYLAMPGIAQKTEQRGGTVITLLPDSAITVEALKLTDIIQ